MFFSAARRCRFTLAIAAAAVAASIVPALTDVWALDFAELADGQWWRIWSGHWTHYDGNHLFWDLLMFVALSSACESRHPRIFLPAILAMMALVTFAVRVTCPDVTQYRGLSGIDTGLFVWFVADRARDAWRSHDQTKASLWLLPCFALVGKLIYEATTGNTLFVDSTNFSPLVESHLAGAGAGLWLGMGKKHKRRTAFNSRSRRARPWKVITVSQN